MGAFGAFLRFFQKNSKITSKSTAQVKWLLKNKQVTQDEITRLLANFYKTKYPDLDLHDIFGTLQKGIK